MNIEKNYKPGDDFVVLKVICEPLPVKMVSVSVQALTDGLITLEDEIARETQEAQVRLEQYRAITALIQG